MYGYSAYFACLKLEQLLFNCMLLQFFCCISAQVQFFQKLIIMQLRSSLDLVSVIPSAPPAAAAPSTSVFSQSYLFYGKHVLTVEALSKAQVRISSFWP